MSQFQDYFSLENHPHTYTDWIQGTSIHAFTANNKSQHDIGSFRSWEAPILSYTLNTLAEDSPATFQLPSPPISPICGNFPTNPDCTISSPAQYCFSTQPASNPIPIPASNPMAGIYIGRPTSPPESMTKVEDDSYFGEPQQFDSNPSQSFGPKAPQRPSARSWRMARHAHTIIERNYRDRLNTKISELSSYLFNDSVSSGIKPSKSTVISQATDRLLHLEKQNKELLAEMETLKQKVITQQSPNDDKSNQKDGVSGLDGGDTDTDTRG